MTFSWPVFLLDNRAEPPSQTVETRVARRLSPTPTCESDAFFQKR